MPPSRLTINRELLIRIFFFSAFAFLLYQTFRLAEPFLPALLASAMLAVAFHPWYLRLHHRLRNANASAFLLTVVVLLLAVAPVVLAAWFFLGESRTLIPTLQNFMESLSNGEALNFQHNLPPVFAGIADRVVAWFQTMNIDIKPWVLDSARDFGGMIAAFSGHLARNAFLILFKIVILVMSLFFLFRDGDRFLRWALNLVPMEATHKQEIARSAYETFRAVTIGVFLTAAAQALVALIGFLVVGVRLPLLLCVAVFMASLLGVSFLVMIPVSLALMADSVGRGVFLLIWGMVVVGWIDNFLKPILIGSRTRMPFFLVFFSLIGGLKVYGLLGVILGPILVASVLSFIQIYRESYSQ